jgi:hypothetical protein
MNRDKLEKFIIDHRDQFNDLEPDPGLWNKIRGKETRTRKINWAGIAWKAAAVVVIFVSSYFFHEYMDSRKGSRLLEQTQMSQDMEGFEDMQVLKDAEAYYTSMINAREEQLIKLLVDDKEILNDIMEEMKELDEIYVQLKKDLKDDVANEEIIEAMVQNYRMKLFILEDILNQLQKTNTNKDEEVKKVRL